VGHLDDPHAVKRQSRPGHGLSLHPFFRARLGLRRRSGKHNLPIDACTVA
jgi:hypothetical protein